MPLPAQTGCKQNVARLDRPHRTRHLGWIRDVVKGPAANLHAQIDTLPTVGRGKWSGRRDSNPRHSAWEADTLPAELLPLGRPHGYQPCAAKITTGVAVVAIVLEGRTVSRATMGR